MKTLLLTSGLLATLLFSGCAGTTGTDMENKVQNKVQDRTTSALLSKVGMSSLTKRKRTNAERAVDVATGKTTVKDEAVDMVADKTANMITSKFL